MKNIVVFAFLALCFVASSQGFLADTGASLSKIIEGKKNLYVDAKHVLDELKQSALQKKLAFIGGVKAAAKAKHNLADSVKEAKMALLKGVATAKRARLAALKAAKSTAFKKFIDAGKSHLSNAVELISTKTEGLLKHKLQVKETAQTLFSNAVNKVHSELAKKKKLLSLVKGSANAIKSVVLVPLATQLNNKLYTYVSGEAPVIGKVFVEENYVTPANRYGPPADTYGSPHNTYGPPDNIY